MNVKQIRDLIDANDMTFLQDMAEQVGLHRFDIPGYGDSRFSDWRRVTGNNADGLYRARGF